MSNMRILGILAVVLTTSSCASDQYYWRHDVIEGAPARQQLIADQRECATSSSAIEVSPPHAGSTRAWGISPDVQQARPDAPYQYGLTNAFSECMAQRGWSLQSPTR